MAPRWQLTDDGSLEYNGQPKPTEVHREDESIHCRERFEPSHALLTFRPLLKHNKME